ncbi:valine--tRNA ligase [Uranotaenia lowii]|uniref:valine--tRNA ligase n=1 Tax=Uranotaenia lowii TaxID=190385 RepID=UPI0024792DD4|nr:valine--tRNA ligase [Uranotaenia lowii]
MFQLFFLGNSGFIRKSFTVAIRHTYLTGFNRRFSAIKALEPAYQPAAVESRNAEVGSKKVDPGKGSRREKFSLLFPPPNVTGDLHLGHALTCTIQDALIRWHRKQGRECVWIPGMDHAGIATQVVVEKRLLKERGLSRHDLGREEFSKEVWKWKQEKSDSIKHNLIRMSCSMDWEREYFTMDERQSVAVKEAFIRLFEDGFIYRDKSLVNWSCSLESAISDIEVDNVEINGPTLLDVPGYKKKVKFGEMVDIAYKVQDSKEEIIISTTRPETMLGDVAVAVNPNDGRYDHLKNNRTMLWHPFRKEEIPLIFDESIDPEFGTGAVKITPAHDKYDYDMAKKHRLPLVEVIDSKGQILEGFGSFGSLPRYEARQKMLDYLATQYLLRDVKPHSMILPVCSRSKDIIEFLLRPQWFVRCKEMSQRAVQAVEAGHLEIIPKQFEKDWFRWLENCHDWCISRQLWWGHRIPVFEAKTNTGSTWIAAKCLDEANSKAQVALNTSDFTIEQDPDVLDTWFSSSLLPFSSLGWPKPSFDQERFYPLDLMETGHDILFFWVARMVMLGQQLTNQLPFKRILLHGVICDENGRKMSKSLGNVIKPEQVIHGASQQQLAEEIETSHRQGVLTSSELKKSLAGQRKMFPNGIPECGTDALRFTLCSSNIKNHFINFNIQECHTNKLFFNKIWQAVRYTLSSVEKFNQAELWLQRSEKDSLSEMDQWILSRLSNTMVTFESAMKTFNFHLATAALKTFFYNNFCDVYLETTKVNMRQEANAIDAAKNHCRVLHYCLRHGLSHLEVFTPFLAAELQSHLPASQEECHPSEWINQPLENEINQLLEICQSIRQAKAEAPVPIARKHRPVLHILSKTDQLTSLLQRHLANVQQLTLCDGVQLHRSEDSFEKLSFTANSTASHECCFGVVTNLTGSQENADQKRGTGVSKKLLKLESELDRLLATVNNEGYRTRANESVQKKHSEKINQLRLQIDNMRKLAI